MKKSILALLVILAVSLVAAGCSSKENASQPDKKPVVKVGATAVPHAEILQFIKPALEKEGVQLEIVEFSDYVRPNVALAEKELDANYFQHVPYLEKFSAERNQALTYTAKVHIEPMGIYSKKIKDIKELTQGAVVAIPNDPTNGGRALAILAKAGLITLKDGVGISGTVKDITNNLKALKIRELEAAMLPRSLDDAVIAVINTNYALEANLVPAKDALVLESKDSPYANVLAIRKGDETRPEIVKLSKTLTSPEVKKFIEEKYKGAIVPAF